MPLSSLTQGSESEQKIYEHLGALGVCPVDSASYLKDCRNDFDEQNFSRSPTCLSVGTGVSSPAPKQLFKGSVLQLSPGPRSPQEQRRIDPFKPKLGKSVFSKPRDSLDDTSYFDS